MLARATCACPKCPPMTLNDPQFAEGEHKLAYVSASDVQQLRAADGIKPGQTPFFSLDTGSNTVRRLR